MSSNYLLSEFDSAAEVDDPDDGTDEAVDIFDNATDKEEYILLAAAVARSVILCSSFSCLAFSNAVVAAAVARSVIL